MVLIIIYISITKRKSKGNSNLLVGCSVPNVEHTFNYTSCKQIKRLEMKNVLSLQQGKQIVRLNYAHLTNNCI